MKTVEKELESLTIIKRLLALSKRKHSPHMKYSLTDIDTVEVINALEILGLIEKHKWFVELITRIAERRTSVKIGDELTRLALSLPQKEVNNLIESYKKKLKEVNLGDL